VTVRAFPSDGFPLPLPEGHAPRAAGIPVAVTMEGGYASDIDDTVDIHVAAFAERVARWPAAGYVLRRPPSRPVACPV
jgi:hypothetical protein